MPTVHKKFRLETEPIETTVDRDGHTTKSFASLNFRVLDAATDIPIGVVLHVRDGKGMKYEATPLYTNSGEPLSPPNGDWDKDVHGAARMLWRDWNNTLPRRTRVGRWFLRWLDVHWAVVGILVGFAISLGLQSIGTKEADSGNADHRSGGDSSLSQAR